MVEKERIVNITSQTLYDQLIRINTLTKINDHYSILDPNYNKDVLINQLYFNGFEDWDMRYYKLDSYFYEVKQNMLGLKVTKVLLEYFYEMVGEFEVFQSLHLNMNNPLSIFSKGKNLIKVTLEFKTENEGCN